MIVDKLRWLAGLDEADYRDVGRRSHERALDFDLRTIAPRFVDVLRAAEPFSFPLSIYARCAGRADRLWWRLLTRLGVNDAVSNRHLREST
jgi:hypothetical protein